MYRTVRKSLSRGFILAAFASLLIVLQAGSARAQWATSGANINNTNTGNVGVGTTAPTSPLEVQAPNSSITLSQAGTAGKTTVQATVGRDLHLSSNAKWSGTAWERFDTNSPSWNFYGSSVSDHFGIRRAPAGTGAVGWTDVFRINNAGNVGIGTRSPDVVLGDTPNGAGGEGVAMGTTVNIHANSGYSMLRLTNGVAGSNEMGRITFGSPGYTGAERRTAVIMSRSESSSTADPSGNLIFFASNAGQMAEKMRITSAGNVGIGTKTPATALHVVGDVTVTGNISAKYQDVAEWVPSSEKLTAGTVVVLDPERSNQVLASNSSYDTTVAGVVSAQPGIALGEAGEGKALVATTGRVKVKVDATRAPIKIGDLLVTSDVAGVAMKSEPILVGGRRIHAPGTIIGKALEPLSGGTGEVLVLLSLQ